uniref:Transmembrane protein n=1 Tax=Chromera velia CCMP2878 TaxID=1169474 RepID=A0A0G4HS27_9ALVE|eukprot:Cvel_30899.t1-p1 / transcript=Cvel_30899.t1 / gene=Cvel_30899 / organism=Chromera_velia_CCMP2878 / gene_product=hypothetical protein / transcript_product=hypothetical protein / location=Cvel_scaffold4492:3850-5211(-) / protein_length=454 / sequence_SO=supercontig / SO=protein_coding / is_pseudo=false
MSNLKRVYRDAFMDNFSPFSNEVRPRLAIDFQRCPQWIWDRVGADIGAGGSFATEGGMTLIVVSCILSLVMDCVTACCWCVNDWFPWSDNRYAFVALLTVLPRYCGIALLSPIFGFRYKDQMQFGLSGVLDDSGEYTGRQITNFNGTEVTERQIWPDGDGEDGCPMGVAPVESVTGVIRDHGDGIATFVFLLPLAAAFVWVFVFACSDWEARYGSTKVRKGRMVWWALIVSPVLFLACIGLLFSAFSPAFGWINLALDFINFVRAQWISMYFNEHREAMNARRWNSTVRERRFRSAVRRALCLGPPSVARPPTEATLQPTIVPVHGGGGGGGNGGTRGASDRRRPSEVPFVQNDVVEIQDLEGGGAQEGHEGVDPFDLNPQPPVAPFEPLETIPEEGGAGGTLDARAEPGGRNLNGSTQAEGASMMVGPSAVSLPGASSLLSIRQSRGPLTVIS